MNELPTEAFNSNDPNLSPVQIQLAQATQALVASLAPEVTGFLNACIQVEGVNIAFNAMSSALINLVAKVNVTAITQAGADPEHVRGVLAEYDLMAAFDLALQNELKRIERDKLDRRPG